MSREGSSAQTPLLSGYTGRRLPVDAGVRLGGGSSFHFLRHVEALRPRSPAVSLLPLSPTGAG